MIWLWFAVWPFLLITIWMITNDYKDEDFKSWQTNLAFHNHKSSLSCHKNIAIHFATTIVIIINNFHAKRVVIASRLKIWIYFDNCHQKDFLKLFINVHFLLTIHTDIRLNRLMLKSVIKVKKCNDMSVYGLIIWLSTSKTKKGVNYSPNLFSGVVYEWTLLLQKYPIPLSLSTYKSLFFLHLAKVIICDPRIWSPLKKKNDYPVLYDWMNRLWSVNLMKKNRQITFFFNAWIQSLIDLTEWLNPHYSFCRIWTFCIAEAEELPESFCFIWSL